MQQSALLREDKDVPSRLGIVSVLASSFPSSGFDEMLDALVSPDYLAKADDLMLLDQVTGVAEVAGYHGYQGPLLHAARTLMLTSGPSSPSPFGGN